VHLHKFYAKLGQQAKKAAKLGTISMDRSKLPGDDHRQDEDLPHPAV
jgi:hypothetical protein